MSHDPTRDCEHGRLKGKCEVCDLQAEAEADKVIIEYHEATIKRLQDEVARLQKREWVGLTAEQISSIWDGHVVPMFGKNGINPIVFAKAIEAKLKEKNAK